MKLWWISITTLFLFSLAAQDYHPNKELPAPKLMDRGSDDIASLNPGEEWRALWVDAWNKGLANPQQVQETIATADRYRYNAIVVQVRRRGDAIYFPNYPNTEPRMNGLADNFDALQEIIDQAHAQNIEVHAWITTFLISTATPSFSPQHVYNKHPEYLTQNYQGEKKIGEGYYLDPGHPQALKWNEKVVMDLVQNYAIDGIHFDYVRYPAQNSGFNPVSVKRYNEKYGLTGQPKPEDPQFSDWRRNQITDWLQEIQGKIIAIKPHMKISAATFASRNDAYHNRFQDWAKWMEQGIIDANVSMNYSTKDSIFQARVDDALKHSYGRHVYMGIGAYLQDPPSIISQMEYARNHKAHGLILFSYANNTKAGKSFDCFEQIYRRLFTTPAKVPQMPWKKN